jgi:hypothetical protein
MRGDASGSLPRESVLKIDKDCFVDPDWIQDYLSVVIAVLGWYGVTVVSVRLCNSRRKGIHFYIGITPPVQAEFALRLQWLLGDDSQRVDLNRARIHSGLKGWNKLFERVGARLRTIYRAPESRLTAFFARSGAGIV